MSEHPIELIARGLLTSGSSILLCRNLACGYYYLPGGHVEFGESAAHAVQRELMEEGGIVATAGACLLVLENAFEARKRRHHELNVVFHVELIEPDPRSVASRESEIGLEWVELASLVDLDLRPAAIKAWLVSGAPPGACAWASTMGE